MHNAKVQQTSTYAINKRATRRRCANIIKHFFAVMLEHKSIFWKHLNTCISPRSLDLTLAGPSGESVGSGRLDEWLLFCVL